MIFRRRRGSFPRAAFPRFVVPLACLALLTLFAGKAPAGTIPANTRPGLRHFQTLVQRGERVFCVGQPFLEAGSDSLVLSGRALARGADYTTDADQGCFRLAESALTDSLAYPALLEIFYRVLPLGLAPVYAHRDLSGGRTSLMPDPSDSTGRSEAAWRGYTGEREPGVGTAPARAVADTTGRSFPLRPVAASPDGSAGSPQLDLAGSKTFTFELGTNRDLSLRQTLDLRVTGNVSRDVTLRAILSDRNLPFQPEGNTAELDELDKILIEVQGPGARVGLGDQDITTNGGTLASFSRRLQGLTAEVTGKGREEKVVAAAQRGEFKSYEFLGRDGKQGPYPLSDRAGGRGIVVVAGSERVWLDGVEMVRGLDNDYTIDYGRAELTFTPRHLITAESRIAVDYQFSAVGYRRSLYLASGRNELLGGRLKLSFETAKEADDKSRPLSGELTAAERAQLAAAGDSLVSGGSGIRRVDTGTGRYRQEYDAANSRTYYRYVGVGAGDFEITFVRIGPGIGDYADSLAGPDTVFVYRGPNTGAYAPAGGLTQPVSHTLGHVMAHLDVPNALSAEGEFAASGYDLNTLSPLQDGDNNGTAGRLNLKSAPLALHVGGLRLGEIEVAGQLRNLGRHFATLGRLDESFSYSRDWNLADRGQPLSENRREMSALYRPLPGTTLSTGWGALSGDGRRSDRHLYELNHAGTSFGSVSVLRVDSSVDTSLYRGRLQRETARTGTQWWLVRPTAFFEHEERIAPESGGGGRYRWGGGDVSIGPFGPLTFSVGMEARDTDSRAAADSLWRKVSRSLTHRGSIQLTGGAVSATGIYQSRNLGDPRSGRSSSDIASLDLSQRSPNAAFATDLHFRVMSTGLEVRSRTLSFVGAGKGNYDQFGNLFPGGGYELDEGPLGPEKLTTDLDIGLKAEMDPYRAAPAAGGGALGWATRNLGWTGTFNVEQQSLLPLGRPAYLFNPSSYQKPGSTLHGRIQVRQQLDIFPKSSAATLQLEQNLDDVANYQYTNFLEDRTEHLVGIALKSTALKLWTAEIEERLGTRSQTVTAGDASARARKARVNETRAALTWQPLNTTRAGLETTWRRENAGGDGRAQSLDFYPHISQVLGARGRLDLAGHWITATRDGGYTGIGGFSSLFLQNRLEMSLDGDYRLRDAITVGAGIAARKYEGSKTVIDGRTEVRAYF